MSKFLSSATITALFLVSACASAPGIVNVAAISDPVQKEAALATLQAQAPKPIQGNGGAYMSPFTSDGVTAEWVTKSMKVQAMGQVGEAAGQIAGDQLLGSIPFAGLFAGHAMKGMARKQALNSIGGEAFLKSSSDQSFNSVEDMAANMYAFHALHPDYARIVRATIAIYPDFAAAYASYPQPKAPPKAKQTAAN